MSDKSSDQKARESFASILSYYLHHRESLETVPDWVDRPESASIIIGLFRDSAPTDEQVETAKEELQTLMALEEIKGKVSETEMDVLMAAASSSRAKRRENKRNIQGG